MRLRPEHQSLCLARWVVRSLVVGLLSSSAAAGSQGRDSHLNLCRNQIVTQGSRLQSELQSGLTAFENLRITEDLHIASPRGFSCYGCCFDGLAIRGTVRGNIELDTIYVRGMLYLGPRLRVDGDIRIAHAELGSLLIEDALVKGRMEIDRTSLQEGGARLDGVAAGGLTITELEHARWSGGDEVPVRGDVRGIEIVNTRVEGAVVVERLGLGGFWAMLEGNGSFTWRGGTVNAIQLQATRFSGPVVLDFDHGPRSLGAGRAQLGNEVILRLSNSDNQGAQRFDFSELAAGFRELPSEKDIVPQLLRGTPSKHLRSALVRLARSYESLGMVDDALKVRHQIASLDLGSAESPLARVTAGLRWLGGGAGADRRVLLFWAGLLLLMTFAQVGLYTCMATPPFKASEDDLDVEKMGALARARLGVGVAASSVLPAPFELGGRPKGCSLVLFAIAQFVVWLLIALFAGTLSGYF